MHNESDMASHMSTLPHPPRRKKGEGWLIVICLVLVVILALIVKNFFLVRGGSFPPVNGSEWQAVFLTNNQVYFGHLKNYSTEYATLNDIFYLRAADPLQQDANPPGSNLNLIKLGGELHGPQDVMYIPKDKIMFWENLKSDSQVAKVIADFLKQK